MAGCGWCGFLSKNILRYFINDVSKFEVYLQMTNYTTTKDMKSSFLYLKCKTIKKKFLDS